MAKARPLFCAFDAARLLIVSLGLIRTPLTSLSNMDPAVFSFLIKAQPRGKDREKKRHLTIREYPHTDVNVCRRWRGHSVRLQVFLQQVCWGFESRWHYPLSTIISASKRRLDSYWPLPLITSLVLWKEGRRRKKQHLHFSGSADFFSVEKHTFCFTAGGWMHSKHVCWAKKRLVRLVIKISN